jgi:hypothetical protein
MTSGVLHLVDNMSDHEPIYAVIKVEEDNLGRSEEKTNVKNESIPKQNWKNASCDQKLEYNDVLFQKLLCMNIPDSAISCKDVKCNDPNHREEIDNYVTTLLNAVSESGKETIPANAKTNKNNSGNAKKTAGWKEFVEPFQDNAHFWHSVWLSAGRPVNTVLHTIMKQSKNRFHYQVRKCKRIEDYLKNNKIVENCLENDTDLFKEIKRQRSNQNDDEVTIDGAADDNIPDKFASIYKDLFNSGTDDNDVKAMKAKID